MSRSLFSLIKTLTKAEKRIFSENLKPTKRRTYYVKLVNVYSKSEAYNFELDKKIFAAKSQNFIGECKVKCKQLLHAYLVTLEKKKGVKNLVKQKFDIATMLLNRKQYRESFKLLEKIDLLATKYELLEELVQIKVKKVVAYLLTSSNDCELDLDYLKILNEDKTKAIQHFVGIHQTLDDSRMALTNWHIKKGGIRCVSRERNLGEDRFKNLTSQLNRYQKKFFELMGDRKYEQALDEVAQVIQITMQNRDVVLEGKLLLISFAPYIMLYVELCVVFNRKVDIDELLSQFDHIPVHTIKEKFELLNGKMATSCMYALSKNNPVSAIPEIQEVNLFLEQYKYLKRDNTANILFCLITYFALEDWKGCLSIIDEIEIEKTSLLTSNAILNIKLICIYMQHDFYYFESLVNSHIKKRRKKGVKVNDYKSFGDCFFYLLYRMAKKEPKLNAGFKRTLNNFDPSKVFLRYFIHWIVCQFTELREGTDYLEFLDKHNYQHYEFKALNKTN